MDVCPHDPELMRFARGDLSDASWQQIAAHLEGCQSCLDRLERLDATAVLAERHSQRPQGSQSARLRNETGAPAEQEFSRLAEKVVPWAWTAQQLREAQQQIDGATQDPLAVPNAAHPESLVHTLLVEPLKPGERLGHYRLLEEIGRGAMGVVFRAEHLALRRQVAVKCLHPRRSGGPEAMLRFRREMSAVGRIDHPNLVRATDAGEIDGHPFLAMEYVVGIDLERLAHAFGPLPIGLACEVIAQAAAGLEHAHGCGLIHRDVKPSNLMLGADGAVRVLDLGLALEQSSSAISLESGSPTSHDFDQTSEGSILGTRAYMAPEQRVSSRQVGPAADVYGLGATLIRLLWGFPPSALATDCERAMAQMPDRKLRPDLPESLWETLQAMVKPSPEQRIRSMQEVMQKLGPYRDPDLLYRCLEDCRRKGLIQWGDSEPIFVAQQAMPPVIASPFPERESSSRMTLWILVGVGMCGVGMLLAAVALGIQLGRNQIALAGNSQAGSVVVESSTGEVPGGEFGSPLNSDSTIAAEPSPRPAVPRPIRGDRVIRLGGGSIEIVDTAYLFTSKESCTIELWLKHENALASRGLGLELMSAPSSDPLASPFASGWSLGIDMLGLGPRWSLTTAGRDISRIGAPGEFNFLSDHWHHLALVKSGESWVLYLDGKQEMNCSNSPIDRMSDSAGNLRIGGTTLATPRSNFHGLIAGIRISEGVRYRGNFEPQFPMEVDASTVSLIDGSSQSTDGQLLRDHSLHARDARLQGGKLIAIP